MSIMLRYIHRIVLSLLFLVTAAACVKENLENVESPVEGYGPDKDGLDLVLAIDMEDFRSGMDIEYGTKAESDGLSAEQNAAIKNITSLFLGIVRNDTRNMVAYRIIASCDGAVTGNDRDHGQQWYTTKNPTWKEGVSTGYYKNHNWRTYVENEGTSSPFYGWGNWPARFNELYKEKTLKYGYTGQKFRGTNDEAYNNDPYYKDDEHYGCWTDATYTATEKDCVGYNGFTKIYQNELANKGVYDYTQFDHDGLYDDDFTSENSFMSYKAGDVMRKSPAVVLTFKFENPMHGPVEQLTRGDYTVYAITNFRESISSIKGTDESGNYVSDHEVIPYVGDMIYMMLMEWDPNEGLPYEKYASFISGTVSLKEVDFKDGTKGEFYDVDDPTKATITNLRDVTDMLRSSNARIISTSCDPITLVPGTNNILHLTMDRTVARSTYRVTNYSKEPLTISDFSLCDHYAQVADEVFHDLYTTEQRFRMDWQAAPDVTSSKAITPFPSSGELTVQPGQTITFFDALMYGGGGRYDEYDAGGKPAPGSTLVPLGYNIKATYNKGEAGEISKELEKVTPAYDIHNTTLTDRPHASLTADADGLVENVGIKGRNGFLYYNAEARRFKTNSAVNSVESLNLLTNEQYQYYLWTFQITRSGSAYKCKIKNQGNGMYLRIPSGTSYGVNNYLSFVSEGQATEFYLTSQNGGSQVSFNSDNGQNGYTVYIHALNSGYDYNVCWAQWGYNDNGSWYYIYDMERETEHHEERHEPFPIEVFNADAGVTSPLYYMYRNDHLIIDINVSYNANIKDIQFDVKNWTPHDYEITFD